jgi:hypothetical protein
MTPSSAFRLMDARIIPDPVGDRPPGMTREKEFGNCNHDNQV